MSQEIPGRKSKPILKWKFSAQRNMVDCHFGTSELNKDKSVHKCDNHKDILE